MTAVPKRLLKAITARDGHRCAWSGQDTDTLVPHHRANRGSGGYKAGDGIANLVWLDAHINGEIESVSEMAEIARGRGIKISKFSTPAEQPIDHAVHGLVTLNDDGTWTAIKEGTT